MIVIASPRNEGVAIHLNSSWLDRRLAALLTMTERNSVSPVHDWNVMDAG
jgi:hypothetical protein